MTNNSSSYRYALPFASGELPRFSPKKVLNPQYLGRLSNTFLDLDSGKLPHFKAKGHVIENSHMGI